MAFPMPSTADQVTGNTLPPPLPLAQEQKKNFTPPSQTPDSFDNEGAGGGAAQPMQTVPDAGLGVLDGLPTTPKSSEHALQFIDWIGQNEGADWGTLYGDATGWNGKLTTTGYPVVNGQPWGGAVGPDGRPTHAFGKGQFEPKTWVDNVNEINAPLSKDSPMRIDVTDASPMNQARVALHIAQKTAGTDFLDQFAAGDRRELSQKLVGQWPSLGGGGETLKSWLNSSVSDAGASNAAVDTQVKLMRENAHNVMGILGQLESAPSDPQLRQELAQAHQERQHLLDTYEKLIKNPPNYKPIDAMQNFGSMASIVALIGGLFARNHATTALAASGAAMKAANSNNADQFERQMKIWDQETAAASKMIDINNSDIRELLDDRRMEFDEKEARIRTFLTAEGFNTQALQAGLTAAEGARNLTMQLERANGAMKDARYQMQYAQFLSAKNAEENKGKSDEEIAREFPAVHESLFGKVGAGGLSSSKPLDIVDKDGKVIGHATGREAKNKVGWVDSETGQPIDVPEGGRLVPSTPSAGRQQAQQLTRITSSGNEAVAALKNAVDLPVGATGGVFMGLQFETPDGLASALRRSGMRALTSQDVEDLKITWIGLSRTLASLESAGAAQGLQNLSKQMDALIPQSNDTPLTVMRRYAEVRQIIERSMETVKSTSAVPPSQAALFDKIVQEAKDAVPWTVQDVNTLERGLNNPGTVKAFAAKVLGGSKGRPEAGTVQDGYKFKGGDPANPQNWEKQ